MQRRSEEISSDLRWAFHEVDSFLKVLAAGALGFSPAPETIQLCPGHLRCTGNRSSVENLLARPKSGLVGPETTAVANSGARSDRVHETGCMDPVSLPRLVDDLLTSAHAAGSGRAAHTIDGDSHHALRQTVIALVAGRVLAEHQGPGEATLQVLRGHVTLVENGTGTVGREGDVLVIPNARHELSAQQDSAVLLTVCVDVGR
ncbi:Cupin domain protein [Gordonia westfalica]|uniref:Cupin domain protein n=2 Tax=Gordonia westfalica TaxID=158898 RepID=A0A1H2LTR8_9ACTN|nr:Cupin domain protein [Gordonia westfalica]